MNITSNPPGADVQIDGVFVGNTPSTLGVSSGDYVVTVSKKGFKAWERKVKITTGKVEIAAELDAEDK
jgi:hypothetical protein